MNADECNRGTEVLVVSKSYPKSTMIIKLWLKCVGFFGLHMKYDVQPPKGQF